MKHLTVFLVLLLLWVAPLQAQNPYSPLPWWPAQFSDSMGRPVANGAVCFTASGTTDNLTVYQTPNGTGHQNPVRLDASGLPPGQGIYLQPGLAYSVKLYAAGTGSTCNSQVVGPLIKSADNVVIPAAAPVLTTKDCSTMAGVDAGAKMAACHAALPASGGVMDGRGFEGMQSIGSVVTISKPVTLLLAGATFNCVSGCFSIATNGVSILGGGTNLSTLNQTGAGWAISTVTTNAGGFGLMVRDLTMTLSATATGCLRIGSSVNAATASWEKTRLSNLSCQGSNNAVAGSYGLSLTAMGQSLVDNIEVRDVETCLLDDRSTADTFIRFRCAFVRYGIYLRGNLGLTGDGITSEHFFTPEVLQCCTTIAGTDGYMMRLDGKAQDISVYSPLYEANNAGTIKTIVWLQTGSANYHEYEGSYLYTAGGTVTNGLLIEAGTANHQWTGCKGSGSTTPVSIGAPDSSQLNLHRFRDCYASLIAAWNLDSAIANGYITVDTNAILVGTTGAAPTTNVKYISGPLKVGGTIITTGVAPFFNYGAAAGSLPPPPLIYTGSTDFSGVVTFGTGTATTTGELAHLAFNKQGPTNFPKCVITPNTPEVGLENLRLSIGAFSSTGFSVVTAVAPMASQPNTQYGFNYICSW